MGQAIAVGRDFTSEEVRQLAKRAKDSSQARRLLAIAAVLDGASRQDAAKAAGMDRQTLRDWVIRFNEKGRTVSSTFLHRERLPSSMTGTRLFSLGSWRRARCRRCMAWCAGGRAI
jgi:transposase